MKIGINIAMNILGLALSLVAISSCDNADTTPTEEQLTLQKLSKNWTLVSAEVDDQDVSEWFTNMKMSYTEAKTFTVQNPVPPIWVASGTFQLEKTGSNYSIIRSDGVEMAVTNLTDTNVTVQFGYTALPGARANSISGLYSFSFQAQ
jgi:hypothetical protein